MAHLPAEASPAAVERSPSRQRVQRGDSSDSTMSSNEKIAYDRYAECIDLEMELRHLRYFIGVVDAGSMAVASRRLHVSQPTLSRQIRDLEREFGVRLFDRVGRR